MAASLEIEGGELSIILVSIIIIGYFIYKGSGSLVSAAQSVGTAVKDAANNTVSAVQGVAPLQSLPTVSSCALVAGTGHTVSELIALGYTPDQINQILADSVQSGKNPVQMPTGISDYCPCPCPVCPYCPGQIG
jgi:uncharacterized protein (UPF0333 family)